jgi:tripartite-type tricarboxylate transporter receptor subunit TctC
MLNRRDCLTAALLLPGLATAQPLQGKTLKILVGFPPGGGTDAIARLLAEALKAELGATVIVDNKAGAGGQLAAQALKNAEPDGTTVFLSHDHTISILPLVLKNPGYQPTKDFMPVAGFASFVNAIALPSATPAKSLPEFLAWVKNEGQGKGVIGVPAPASVPEFLVKALAAKQGLDLVPLPYRGSAPMMIEMLGGQIAAGVGSVPDLIDNHRAGRVRIVATMGGARQSLLPEVPTLAELGFGGYEDLPYYGLFAPAATPAALLATWSKALERVLQQAALRERLTAMGLAVGFMSGAQLATRERAYAQSWARLIQASGFLPQ